MDGKIVRMQMRIIRDGVVVIYRGIVIWNV
jgi:hypothetical protein